jgi:hypothetical protein
MLPPNSVSAVVAVGSETLLVRPVVSTPEPQIPIDTSVIAEGGGAGGLRPAAMCSSPETPMVVAYELDTGAYRWHQCGSASFVTLAAATEAAVYVQAVDGSSSDVRVFDASTGEALDSVSVAELGAVLPDDAALPSDRPPATPGVRLSGGQDDPLIATDAETGDQLWSVRDVLAYDDVWAVGDGAVYMLHFGEPGGSGVAASVRAYDVATGDVRWETAWPQAAYPWWVADGKVYSIWTDLSVLSTATGEVLWATDYGTNGFPGMRGVLANGDTVFVSFASGFGSGD